MCTQRDASIHPITSFDPPVTSATPAATGRSPAKEAPQARGQNRNGAPAEQIADAYAAAGWPADTAKLWPRAAGQVISLLASLSQERRTTRERQKRYREFAVVTADKAIGLFARSGLFRADGSARHYEAITGADDLVYALLQLHCLLSRPDRPLPHIDVNL